MLTKPCSHQNNDSYEYRAGDYRRYTIDATKLETELEWKAEETFDTSIVKTVEWYLQKISNRR